MFTGVSAVTCQGRKNDVDGDALNIYNGIGYPF